VLKMGGLPWEQAFSTGNGVIQMLGSHGGKVNSHSNRFLLEAAFFCALAAVAHVGCILFGGAWYRFLGAGFIKRLALSRLALVGYLPLALINSGENLARQLL
jgi:hypothetical protein